MRIVVGVLRGGPSPEYGASLKSGASVLSALNKERYDGRDIFIDKAGQWHLHGIPAAPERVLRGVDVAFNALHGQYGEDGQVQRLLDVLGVPYTGSRSFAAAATHVKSRARDIVAAAGVRVPFGTVLDGEKITDLAATARNLFRSMPQPSVVRPVIGGQTYVADSYQALEWALAQALAQSPKVLVEEYINGVRASVGVIDDFRNERTYALIPEPSTLSHEEKELLVRAAKQAHEALGLSHYSQVRLRINRRGAYFTQAFAQPHLYEDSSLNSSLAVVGAHLPHFVDHVLQLARNSHERLS